MAWTGPSLGSSGRPAVKEISLRSRFEMSLLHFRCKERRRTLRVALTVPLTVHGKTDSGEKFCAQTHSQSVNRHGALFQLEEIVLVGQTLILMNDHTAQSMECRVVSIHRARDSKQYIGVEFI